MLYKNRFVINSEKIKKDTVDKDKKSFHKRAFISRVLDANWIFWIGANSVGQIAADDNIVLWDLTLLKRASWFYNRCYHIPYWYVFVIFCLFFRSELSRVLKGGTFLSSRVWALVDYRVLNSLEVLGQVLSFDFLVFHNISLIRIWRFLILLLKQISVYSWFCGVILNIFVFLSMRSICDLLIRLCFGFLSLILRF